MLIKITGNSDRNTNFLQKNLVSYYESNLRGLLNSQRKNTLSSNDSLIQIWD